MYKIILKLINITNVDMQQMNISNSKIKLTTIITNKLYQKNN